MPTIDRTAAELPVTIKASSYTVLPSDIGIEIQFLSDSVVSANLPSVAAVENGYNLVIRNIGTGTLTIDPEGSELIDSQSTLSLAMGDWHWIRSDATSWKTIASNSTELSDGSVTTAKLADNSVTGAKIAMGGDVQGDILYYDGTDYTRLAAGTSGQVLKTNGAGANPEWVDAASGGGVIIQSLYQAYTSQATLTSNIPLDNTTPQNTEGTEIFSMPFTPQSATNELELEVNCWGACSTTAHLIGAFFKDSDANALSAGVFGMTTPANGTLKYRITAGSTTTATYKFRIGPNIGDFYPNSVGAADQFNGLAQSTMTITEIEA